mgnify:FL=1
MHILFICNQGKNRSKTAARLFKNSCSTNFAGLYCPKPVTHEQLACADVIVVMEEKHRREIAERFPSIYLQKRIRLLGIPDIYRYGQPELIEMLVRKMRESLNLICEPNH